MNHATLTALFSLALIALPGCGQMGPLYLPAEEVAEERVEDTGQTPAPEEPLQEEFGIDSRDGEFGSKAQ